MAQLMDLTRPLLVFIETVLRDVPGALPALLALPVLVVIASRQTIYIVTCVFLVLTSIVGMAEGAVRPEWFVLSTGAAIAAWVVAIMSFQALKSAKIMRELLEQTGALHAEAEGLRLHAERTALATLRPPFGQTTLDTSQTTPFRDRESPVSRLTPSNRPTG
jgi:hypothetical protein